MVEFMPPTPSLTLLPMRTLLCLATLLLGTACQRAAPAAVLPGPPSATGTAPSAAAPPRWTTAQEACVDRWLAARALDSYGSPQGTMYAGGTPLFDEVTGQRTSRQDFLAQHKPEAVKSCGL